jgi:glycosyltransferase involved in cell wall biosynthesis
MPLAIIEAMMCARPVVATDVAGHSAIIDDGITGFLADAPTASSMNKTLERLWAMRLHLKSVGRAAAVAIRERVPSDPVRVFVEKIQLLAGFT